MVDVVSKTGDSVHLFCVTAHHKRVTVLLISQNLFLGGKHGRIISLNCHYALVFKNARVVKQVTTFGSQVFPGRSDYFQKATAAPYGYMLIDMSPSMPDKHRLRTDILPGQDTKVCVPRL